VTIHETIPIPEATLARRRERATQTDAPDPVDVATMLDAGPGTPRRRSPRGSSRRQKPLGASRSASHRRAASLPLRRRTRALDRLPAQPEAALAGKRWRRDASVGTARPHRLKASVGRRSSSRASFHAIRMVRRRVGSVAQAGGLLATTQDAIDQLVAPTGAALDSSRKQRNSIRATSEARSIHE
jgi:hypothetical protein